MKYKYSVGGAYEAGNEYLNQMQKLFAEQDNGESDFVIQAKYIDSLYTFDNRRAEINTLTKELEVEHSNEIDILTELDIFYSTNKEEKFNFEVLESYYALKGESKGLMLEINSALEVFRHFGDINITSGVRGVINKGAKERSLHPHGYAVDITLSKAIRDNLDQIKRYMTDYDILDEGDHIHLEYNLKTKKKKGMYGLGDYLSLINNMYGRIDLLSSGSQYMLNLILNQDLFNYGSLNIANVILHDSIFNYGNLNIGMNKKFSFNQQLNQAQQKQQTQLSTLNNSGVYGLMDMVMLGSGTIAKTATQGITSAGQAAQEFMKTGDAFHSMSTMTSNILVVGEVMSAIDGVRQQIKAQKQEAANRSMQNLGAIQSVNTLIGKTKADVDETRQRMESRKRLVFYNFNNSGINNNLILYKNGGKYKVK